MAGLLKVPISRKGCSLELSCQFLVEYPGCHGSLGRSDLAMSIPIVSGSLSFSVLLIFFQLTDPWSFRNGMESSSGKWFCHIRHLQLVGWGLKPSAIEIFQLQTASVPNRLIANGGYGRIIFLKMIPFHSWNSMDPLIGKRLVGLKMIETLRLLVLTWQGQNDPVNHGTQGIPPETGRKALMSNPFYW